MCFLSHSWMNKTARDDDDDDDGDDSTLLGGRAARGVRCVLPKDRIGQT